LYTAGVFAGQQWHKRTPARRLHGQRRLALADGLLLLRLGDADALVLRNLADLGQLVRGQAVRQVILRASRTCCQMWVR
jgi:hypothetical protein